MSIYVVRHGQTDWNLQKRAQGRKDIMLNENGIEQARNLKESLNGIKFGKVISSPLKRAKETAEILAPGSVIEDNRIIERDFGEFEGLSAKEFDNDGFWSYKKNCTYKSAENIRDVFNRVYNFLDELENEHKDEDVLVVTHGGILVVINTYFNGIPEDDDLFNVNLKNCGINKFDF